jgi:hypothetical protein
VAPVARQFVQPTGVVAGIGLLMLLDSPVDVLGDQRSDHVHDVAPVVAEASKTLNRLPGVRRASASNWFATAWCIAICSLGAERLIVGYQVFIAGERVFEFFMPRLDQEGPVILVAGIQQLQVESLVGPLR